MPKKATAPRPTKAEITEARDLHLRGECVSTASAYCRANIGDMLRGAQQIYDWMKGAEPPAQDLGD
jgi:hypothetical protein